MITNQRATNLETEILGTHVLRMLKEGLDIIVEHNNQINYQIALGINIYIYFLWSIFNLKNLNFAILFPFPTLIFRIRLLWLLLMVKI